MGSQVSPKVVGATIIGFALVAGAYVASNFGESNFNSQQQPANLQAAETTTIRTAIVVTDTDHNGIEDWRDEFVKNETIVLDKETDDYSTPTTLSGQTGIHLMEGILSARTYGPLGRTNEEIIDGTVNSLITQTKIAAYDSTEISIMTEWGEQDIVNYANTAAATIYRHSNPELEHEMDILFEVTRNGKTEKLSELAAIRDIYKGYLDDTLQIPVPKILAKPHLDLINTYQAIYEDLDGMTHTIDDPLVALMHINRYQDDTVGLAMALRNMYEALEPYAEFFTPEDPAVLFVVFSEGYQL